MTEVKYNSRYVKAESEKGFTKPKQRKISQRYKPDETKPMTKLNTENSKCRRMIELRRWTFPKRTENNTHGQGREQGKTLKPEHLNSRWSRFYHLLLPQCPQLKRENENSIYLKN